MRRALKSSAGDFCIPRRCSCRSLQPFRARPPHSATRHSVWSVRHPPATPLRQRRRVDHRGARGPHPTAAHPHHIGLDDHHVPDHGSIRTECFHFHPGLPRAQARRPGASTTRVDRRFAWLRGAACHAGSEAPHRQRASIRTSSASRIRGRGSLGSSYTSTPAPPPTAPGGSPGAISSISFLWRSASLSSGATTCCVARRRWRYTTSGWAATFPSP